MRNTALLLAWPSLHPTNSIGKGVLSGGGPIVVLQALEDFEVFHGHGLAAVQGRDPFPNCFSIFLAEWLDQPVLLLDRLKGNEQFIESLIRKVPNALNES